MVYNTNIIKSIFIGEKSIQILIPNFHKFCIATKEFLSLTGSFYVLLYAKMQITFM